MQPLDLMLTVAAIAAIGIAFAAGFFGVAAVGVLAGAAAVYGPGAGTS